MEYEIVNLNDQAMGVTYVNDKVTFVFNALVGEIVTLDIIKSTSKYNIAKVKEYIKKVDQRCDAMCPFYEECGGCHLQHMSYDDSIKYKEDKLKLILHKFGKIDDEVSMVRCKHNLNYRNKITLKVKNGNIGYYSYKTNDIVKIDKCLIASDNINKFISYISQFNVKNGEVVIRENFNQELLIRFISDDKIKLVEIPDLKIVGIIQNNKVLKGDNSFVDKINNKFFKISYDSFFQVNREMAGNIFNIIRDNILKDSTVLDLYSGVGTLGINVGDISKKVYGIEIIENAVLNSVSNANANKVKNASYMLGDASKVIDKIKDTIDVVIVDPPRSGLSKHEVDVLQNINPKQIIYVSCDPITLARDLKLLKDNYNINKIYGLDMFPYTYHVESLVILERR